MQALEKLRLLHADLEMFQFVFRCPKTAYSFLWNSNTYFHYRVMPLQSCSPVNSKHQMKFTINSFYITAKLPALF